jgi:hypothetical protein
MVIPGGGQRRRAGGQAFIRSKCSQTGSPDLMNKFTKFYAWPNPCRYLEMNLIDHIAFTREVIDFFARYVERAEFFFVLAACRLENQTVLLDVADRS